MDTTARKRRIECKPELVISSLQRFYATHPEIDKLLVYLNGEAPISLRVIDWFVTKYSRKTFVRYLLKGQEFLVYLSYKGQLKAYSKQYFDPNCRRERIMFKIPGKEPFMTTIGKLNFFRWAFESGVLDYIEAHQEEIRAGYNAYLKETMSNQKRNQKRGQNNDSVSSTCSTSSACSTSSILSTDSDRAVAVKLDPSMRITRRRTKQTPSSLSQLQVYPTPIVLDFT